MAFSPTTFNLQSFTGVDMDFLPHTSTTKSSPVTWLPQFTPWLPPTKSHQIHSLHFISPSLACLNSPSPCLWAGCPSLNDGILSNNFYPAIVHWGWHGSSCSYLNCQVIACNLVAPVYTMASAHQALSDLLLSLPVGLRKDNAGLKLSSKYSSFYLIPKY